MLQMLIAWLTLSILGGLGEENVLGIRQSDADGCSGDSHEQQVGVDSSNDAVASILVAG